MIDVALLGIIRRWHLRDQVPLREIAKRLGISRNTVRRYLRSEITEPTYAERQSASAIDPYAFQFSGWLKTEAAKSLKQLHEELINLGFKRRAYDRGAVFARQWREGQRSGSIRRENEQIVGGIRHAVFATNVFDLPASFDGFQYSDDLCFCRSVLAHCYSPLAY